MLLSWAKPFSINAVVISISAFGSNKLTIGIVLLNFYLANGMDNGVARYLELLNLLNAFINFY